MSATYSGPGLIACVSINSVTQSPGVIVSKGRNYRLCNFGRSKEKLVSDMRTKLQQLGELSR